METIEARIEAIQTERGWLAILRRRGLGAQADSREAAIKEVRETVELIDRLAARWQKRNQADGMAAADA